MRVCKSASKSEFMARMGLDRRHPIHRQLYATMQAEAIQGRQRIINACDIHPPQPLTAAQDGNNNQNQNRQPTRAVAHIHHDIWCRELSRIHQLASPATKILYDLGVDGQAPDRPNWIIEWILWHAFRHREDRSRKPTLAPHGGGKDLCSIRASTLVADAALNDQMRPGSQYLVSDAQMRELVSTYLSLLHGRPFTIFLADDLRLSTRTSQMPLYLLYSICAMGCMVHPNERLQRLSISLAAGAKAHLETDTQCASIAKVQCSILLAQSCASRGEPASALVYLWVASRMAYQAELHVTPGTDRDHDNASKTLLWPALVFLDTWHSSGMGYTPRYHIERQYPAVSLDDGALFSGSPPRRYVAPPHWPQTELEYTALLCGLYPAIQDVCDAAISQRVDSVGGFDALCTLSKKLEAWHTNLPSTMRMTNANLHAAKCDGSISRVLLLNLTYHYCATLLCFPSLTYGIYGRPATVTFVERCRHHATQASDLLQQMVDMLEYVAIQDVLSHMAMVSSVALLYIALDGGVDEASLARQRLLANFQVLLKASNPGAYTQQKIDRFLEFQHECLQSPDMNPHRLDRWMYHFLFRFTTPELNRSKDKSAQASP